MIALAISVLFGLGFAYFATRNTTTIEVDLVYTKINNIPIYIVVLGSLLIGIILSWLLNLLNSIPTRLNNRGKELTIKDAKKEIAELTRKIHQLEIENVSLKNQNGLEEELDDKAL